MRDAKWNRLQPWALALAAAASVALWQLATVSANYGGNWTALFCAGAKRPHPPLAAAEHVYLFPGSFGFDGQVYHYIAHDPFLRTELKTYVDDPRLRYRRILVPLLAHGLAFGQTGGIDAAYGVVCLLSIGLGVWWSCRYAGSVLLPPAWGLLFLAMPATLVTMDRLVVDGGLAALAAAFLFYGRSPGWKLWVVLACAALTRETGLLLTAAYCAHLAWQRAFRTAGVFLLSAAPAAAWFAYVHAHTAAAPYGASLVPASAILRVLGSPWRYPSGTPFAGAVVAADYLALAGVLLAFGLSFVTLARNPRQPGPIAAGLFAAMALTLQRTDHWQNVYDYGRVYTPVLLCLAAMAAEARRPWLLIPVAMMLPRLAIQLTPQVMGVLRAMV